MRKFLVACIAVASLAIGATTAQAYTGHAGCPSYIPPNTGAYCAYHTGIRSFSVYASVKHGVSIPGALDGFCSPGPCTANTGWRSTGWNGRPYILNTSPYGLYVYDGEDYG